MEDYRKADPGGENLHDEFVEIGDSIILVQNVESTEDFELSGNVEYCEEETDEQKLKKFLEDIDMISIFDYLQGKKISCNIQLLIFNSFFLLYQHHKLHTEVCHTWTNRT